MRSKTYALKKNVRAYDACSKNSTRVSRALYCIHIATTRSQDTHEPNTKNPGSLTIVVIAHWHAPGTPLLSLAVMVCLETVPLCNDAGGIFDARWLFRLTIRVDTKDQHSHVDFVTFIAIACIICHVFMHAWKIKFKVYYKFILSPPFWRGSLF